MQTAFALALLLSVQQANAADSVLAIAQSLVAEMPGKAAAHSFGFRAPLVGRLVDRVPFQGEHWMHFDRVGLQYASSILRSGPSAPADLEQPTFVMFSRLGEDVRPVAVAYTRLLTSDEPTPGRIGDVDAPWHEHQKCLDVPGETHVLAHGPEDCVARGGTPTRTRVAMIHVWTTPNPAGRFANYNPALPFLALGLTPPDSTTLASPAQSLRIRKLALALAEMYDARLPYARRSEHFNRSVALAESLAVRRTAIATLVPILLAADENGDRLKYDRAADQVIRHGEALRALYRKMALTPEVRDEVDAEYQRMLAPASHHH